MVDIGPFSNCLPEMKWFGHFRPFLMLKKIVHLEKFKQNLQYFFENLKNN